MTMNKNIEEIAIRFISGTGVTDPLGALNFIKSQFKDYDLSLAFQRAELGDVDAVGFIGRMLGYYEARQAASENISHVGALILTSSDTKISSDDGDRRFMEIKNPK